MMIIMHMVKGKVIRYGLSVSSRLAGISIIPEPGPPGRQQRARGSGQGRGNCTRGRGRGHLVPVDAIAETHVPSELSSSSQTSDGDSSQSENISCEESAAEEDGGVGRPMPSSASRPARQLDRDSSTRSPAPMQAREKPPDASATSMWDRSTFWVKDIPITRRTDTPVLWYVSAMNH